MAIQHWSDEIIIVDLPNEPETANVLISLGEILTEKRECNVVVDFSSAGEITSDSLSRLVKLHQLTAQEGRRFVLCGIDPATEDLLSVTGLAGVFDLTEDRCTALATLEMIG